ncbi:MAG: pyridoxamine 5'-phosphate oxidase, partial [Hyphomicrobiaceae bacterium]
RRSNDNPLTSERATLLGRLVLSDDPSVARRYLVWHPQAAGWSGFADFNFWVMDVTSAHLIAGFGRIVEVAGAELLGTVDNIASGDA